MNRRCLGTAAALDRTSQRHTGRRTSQRLIHQYRSARRRKCCNRSPGSPRSTKTICLHRRQCTARRRTVLWMLRRYPHHKRRNKLHWSQRFHRRRSARQRIRQCRSRSYAVQERARQGAILVVPCMRRVAQYSRQTGYCEECYTINDRPSFNTSDSQGTTVFRAWASVTR